MSLRHRNVCGRTCQNTANRAILPTLIAVIQLPCENTGAGDAAVITTRSLDRHDVRIEQVGFIRRLADIALLRDDREGGSLSRRAGQVPGTESSVAVTSVRLPR